MKALTHKSMNRKQFTEFHLKNSLKETSLKVLKGFKRSKFLTETEILFLIITKF